MPAAAAVLAATVAVAFALFTLNRASQTAWDALWAFLFSANWHFASVGTDYFQADGPVSPVQHFWSLAVEEQFYFIWPWLILLIFTLGGKSTKWDQTKAHRAVAIAMLIIVTASFVWAVVETLISPTSAYFSTFSRAWELGVGALIAVFASAFSRIPVRLRPILGWAGIAGIVWSMMTIRADMAFPAPWAAVPVLATALVILAGTGAQQRFMWPLTNKGTGYVGAISYSLYLWHFPVIVLLAAVMDQTTPGYFAAAILLTAVLAATAYHFIEKPVLDSGWLETPDARRRNRSASASARARLQYTGLGLLALATAGVVAASLLQTSGYGRSSHAVAASGPTPSSSLAATGKTPEAVLADEVSAALAATAWPDLTPTLDELGESSWAPEIVDDGCLSVSDDNLSSCVYGPANTTKTAAVVGDSMAASWMPTIRAVLEPKGYRIQMLTLSGCPAFVIEMRSEHAADCNAHRTWTQEKLDALNPDLIVMANAFEDIAGMENRSPQETAAAWKAAGIKFLNQLPADSSFIMLSAPQGGKNLTECATKLSAPSDCVSTVGEFRKMIDRAAAEAVASASRANAAYVDTTSWFCVMDKCPGFIGNNPVRIDAGHLTGVFAKSLGPVLAEALKSKLPSV
ncbi:SGNH hydrolase domain-containing protein [Arthrobacter sp. AD-310]